MSGKTQESPTPTPDGSAPSPVRLQMHKVRHADAAFVPKYQWVELPARENPPTTGDSGKTSSVFYVFTVGHQVRTTDRGVRVFLPCQVPSGEFREWAVSYSTYARLRAQFKATCAKYGLYVQLTEFKNSGDPRFLVLTKKEAEFVIGMGL